MSPQNSTPFTAKMYELCRIAPKRANGYRPGDFLSALRAAGNDFAPRAKQFLHDEGLHSGLERLAKENALDISMEWSVAYDNWPEFSPEDRLAAYERLRLVAAMHGRDDPPALSD